METKGYDLGNNDTLSCQVYRNTLSFSIAVGRTASLSLIMEIFFCSPSFSWGILPFSLLHEHIALCWIGARLSLPPPLPSSSSLSFCGGDTLYLCSHKGVINLRVCLGSLLPAGGPSVHGGWPRTVPGRRSLPNTHNPKGFGLIDLDCGVKYCASGKSFSWFTTHMCIYMALY